VSAVTVAKLDELCTAAWDTKVLVKLPEAMAAFRVELRAFTVSSNDAVVIPSLRTVIA
jgi:hypothetical protein